MPLSMYKRESESVTQSFVICRHDHLKLQSIAARMSIFIWTVVS